jgi:ankyrin repeat protein
MKKAKKAQPNESELSDVIASINSVLSPRFDDVIFADSEFFCYDPETDLELHLPVDEVQEHFNRGDLRQWLQAIVDGAVGVTPLMMAASAGHARDVRELLQGRADVDATDGEGLTALDHAARSGHREVVRLLLKAGGKRATKRASSALALAASQGHAALVRELLPVVPTVHLAKQPESAALAQAACGGHLEVVRLLLGTEPGPAPGLVSVALNQAVNEGHQEVFNLLAPLADPRTVAAARKKLDAILRGQRRQEQPNQPAANENTLRLVRAAGAGKIETIRQRLAAGADVNGLDRKGRSALYRAIQEEKPDVVRLLIEAGADVNAQSGERGTTPLMAAARRGGELGLLLIRMLCQAGADVNARDYDGQTALDYACTAGYGIPDLGYADVMAELVRLGADCGDRSVEARVKELRQRVKADRRDWDQLGQALGRPSAQLGPARIHLKRQRRLEWLKWEHEQAGRRYLEQLRQAGLRPAGMYTVKEAPGLQFWALVSAKESVYALVYEYLLDEVWFDLVTCYADRTTLTYTTKAGELIPRPGYPKERVAGSDAAAAYERMLRERPQQPLKPVSAGQLAADLEWFYAKEMAWRKGRKGNRS